MPPATKKRLNAKAASSYLEEAQAGTGQRTQRNDAAPAPIPEGRTRKTLKRPAEDSQPSEAKRARKQAGDVVALNQRPTRPLNVYVMGANSGAELGLGPEFKSNNVIRPLLNPHLSGEVGVVQVSSGAMHSAALTYTNKILTWGVNDHGALGRDTTWDGGLVEMNDGEDVDMKDGSDSDSEIGGDLNPEESTPRQIDMSGIPPETQFAQVATTNNATFALTTDGLVYGWGTFRSYDGELSFSPTVEIQRQPTLIPSLKKVKKISGGAEHVVALTSNGFVYTWGSRGTQGQLGRRFAPRIVDWRKEGLLPRRVANLRGIADVWTGSSHSFAVDAKEGTVYSWGINNAGQTGVDENMGEYGGAVDMPTPVASLRDYYGRIVQMAGGEFHTLALTTEGKCLAWGRLYSFATGTKFDSLPEGFIIRDERGKPSILRTPTVVEDGDFPTPLSFIAAAGEHSLAVAADGSVYSWGLNLSNQIGQGDEEEIKTPTRVKGKSIREKQIVWVGTGAQYSMLGELRDR